MKIYHQSYQGKHSTVNCYQFKNSIQKLSMTTSIEELLFECRKESDSVFLLDESYFDLIACPIEWSFYEPMSIQTIDALVESQFKKLTKERKVSWKLLLYDINHITIDQQQSSYLLWKTWYIEFQLSLIAIKPSLLTICPSLSHKDYWPRVYPASYFTLQFITHNLQKESFSIVTIAENSTRLVAIHNWWYHTIQSLDRWYQHIKEMCSQHNILSYFYKSDEDLQANPIAYSIMQQSMLFYNKMLVDRIASYSPPHTDSIVIAPQLNHHVFWESFTELYQKKINGYIVPFSFTDSLEHYGKKRQAHELDILTCLNLLHDKQLVW